MIEHTENLQLISTEKTPKAFQICENCEVWPWRPVYIYILSEFCGLSIVILFLPQDLAQ